MPKLILRAALAGCATAGLAVAQITPPPLPVTPPVPTPPVTTTGFTTKMVLKTFDVADLVCPPADSPLARPGSDPAMMAAAKAFTEVRTAELLGCVRKVARGTWEEAGGPGKLAVTTDGKTLVVSNTAGACDDVGECVQSFRKLRSAVVKVDVVLVQVDSGEMKQVFGDKGTAVCADDLSGTMKRLKACGSLEVLTRPTLMLTNKQTGFFQVEQVIPEVNGRRCVPVGTTSRITPDVSADGKTVGLAVELKHSDCCNGKVDCQQVQTNLLVPDGGTVAVKVGTREVQRRVESKVPVVSDVPYLGRLFHTIGIGSEKQDVVAVFTATRVADAPVAPPAMTYATPLPAAPTPVMLPLGIPTTTPLTVPPMPAWVAAPPPTGVKLAGGVVGTTLCGGVACDDTAGLMAAYKSACAAGRTDDATRLALQLLAKDPTCFGKK